MGSNFLSKIKASIIQAFCLNVAAPDDVSPAVYANPTEEIADAMKRGKQIKIHGMAAGDIPAGIPKRLEENYLFGSRRFPSASTNVLPAPPSLTGGQFGFFSTQIGADGGGQGFPAGFRLTANETNMEAAGQVPQGKAFRLVQMGISFNTEATHDNIEQVLDGGSVLFQKQGVQWGMRQGPFRFWPGGQGVSMATQQQGSEAAHNGVADIRSARYMKIPRDIHNLESFDYLYDCPRSTRATDGSDWSLSDFVVCSVWLWGAQMDRIPD
jgi:hypothetical protein